MLNSLNRLLRAHSTNQIGLTLWNEYRLFLGLVFRAPGVGHWPECGRIRTSQEPPRAASLVIKELRDNLFQGPGITRTESRARSSESGTSHVDRTRQGSTLLQAHEPCWLPQWHKQLGFVKRFAPGSCLCGMKSERKK